MTQRAGDLAGRALPAVLFDLYDEQAAGRLSLRRGGIVKSFDFVGGNPISAASTPRDETLGQFLLARGVITDEQHAAAVATLSAGGARLGETLVAMGCAGRRAGGSSPRACRHLRACSCGCPS